MLLHLEGRSQKLTLIEYKRKDILSHSLEGGAQDLVCEEEIKQVRKNGVWEKLTAAKGNFI